MAKKQTSPETSSEEVVTGNEAEPMVEVVVEEANASVLEEPMSEIETLKQQLLRTAADFDNYRRRTRLEKEDLQKFANRKVLADLLPVTDNFERALQSFVQEEVASAEMKTGIEMVYRQMMSILQQHGVEEIEALGTAFDPNMHDAVMQEPANDGGAGVVSGVLQKGYTLHGKVLRPAMVKVTV